MNFNPFKRKAVQVIEEPKTEKRAGTVLTSLAYGTVSSTSTSNESLQLSAVYRCVEVISNSIASLPLAPYKLQGDGSYKEDKTHSLYKLLGTKPNNYQTRFTFIKTLVSNMLLHGNGYAYIARDSNGNAISLQLLAPQEVTVLITKDRKSVSYRHKAFTQDIPSHDMIHLLNYSIDGVIGLSTLAYADFAISTGRAADMQAKGFFSGGANLSGILQVKSGLDEGQAEEIQMKWRNTLSSTTGNPNGIVVLEGDEMQFQPISVNPADAQMLESRKFTVIEICRFFGVSPVKAFDVGSNSFNNIEQSQLSYLTDTLTPLLEKIENELDVKIFRPSETKEYRVEFDIEALLRTDINSQAEYYSKLFNIGVISVNEIRKKLNMSPIEYGDKHFINGALLPIDYAYDTKDNKAKKVINENTEDNE